MAVYVIIFYFFYGVPAAYIIIITRASSSIISLLRHKSDEWTSRLQTSRVQRELWFLHIVVHLYQTTGNTKIQICTCTNTNTQTQLWFLYIVCLYNTSHSCSTQREPNYQNICPLPHWVSPPFRTRVWINKASTKIIASKFSVSQKKRSPKIFSPESKCWRWSFLFTQALAWPGSCQTQRGGLWRKSN